MKTTDKSGEYLCYVALHDCGGWRAVTVISNETPAKRREIAKDVGSWVKAGLRIETWTVEKFRKESRMCQCLKSKKKTKKQQGDLELNA